MPANKINQSSSRLLRTTDDDRPLARDLKDLFSTLVVSLLPLTAHRVRFTKVEYSFLSEDAIHNLGNLKLLQSNRMPDPKDPTRTVISTSTTIFSMSKDMACSLCQRFLDAHFIESADGKHEPVFNPKGWVWKLTSKGITILNWFCLKNGIEHDQIPDLVNLITTPLITLERNQETDKLYLDRGTIEVIYCRLVGVGGRGNKAPMLMNDSTYKNLAGVRMLAERKVNGRVYHDTFTGQAVGDWLMDYTTTMDIREAVELAALFVHHDLIETVVQDRAHAAQFPRCKLFQPTQAAVYALSQRGQDLVENSSSGRCSSEGKGDGSSHHGSANDSNSQRLDKILTDPTLRLLFRENLRDTHCEENLSFYQEVDDFIRQCKMAVRTLQVTDTASVDSAKELLAQSYIIFNTFLAPGSPRELNINHQLRISLSDRMTKAQAQDATVADTLQEVTSLFEGAQNAVFKLMASDSVPKFLHNPKAEYRLVQAGIR
ncbi:regulator of G protein signaling domain-containing protein [Thelonectria olida]|uniref:Regulator of G protein signaling domain-containing protein n=1 Tax=Thelonectria olida TaxID=1576542 RepID=A0A9P8VYI0_9HYPO|nr:regulator of G protein signaling domain-containing protein [Thelonectria olida]